jgi:gliding motility-associated-like protein
VTQPSVLNTSVIPTNILCNGNSTGSVDLTPQGGTLGYTYNWSNGSTNQDLTSLGAGTYSVTVRDLNNCTSTNSVTLTQPTALQTSTLQVIPQTCQSNGSVSVSVSGGTSTYNYNWSNGGNTQNISGLTAGSYNLTITDSNGCSITNGPNNIINIAPPTVTLASTNNITCNGLSNGSLSISTIGGTPQYNYQWSNGATTQNISAIPAGAYSVTVTDSLGCVLNLNALNVTQPLVLSLNSVPTNILCNSASTGSVNITTSGGTSAYSYLWNNGATTEDLNSLSIGSYTVTVTDANNCTTTNSVTLTQPPLLQTSTVQVIPQTCTNNGSVSVSVNGGTSTYNYSWSNGGTTQNISGLQPGNYSLTITDSNGCSITNGPNNIINIAPPTVTLASTNNVSCNSLSNGSLSISTIGGTPQYNYQWSNGATTQNISAIPAGSYSVTVTDSLGCVLNLNALNVSQPAVLASNANVTNLLCFNDNSGSMLTSTAGGTSPYNYLWNVGLTAQNLTSASAGIYTVSITDANGCLTVINDTITEPPLLQTSTLQVIPQTCTNNGSVSVSVSGGTSIYNYSWSNGGTTQNISGLQPGTYNLTITDSNGCSVSNGPNSIVNIAAPTVTLASTTNVSCNSFTDGSLNVNIVGGTPQYIYQWSNGASTQNISALSAGSYSLTVTDSLGCVLNLNALNVSQPAVLASNANVTNLLCYNDNSGSMLTSTAGGTTPYNYLWNVGLTAQNLTSASAGIYTVSITDANGCLTIINDTITEPPLLQTSTLQVIPQTCTNDGSVTVSVSGGTSIYNYNWSNGSTTQNISGLQPGTYNLTITDSNGCFVSNGPNSIVNIGAPTVTLASTTNVSCNSFTDGSLNVNIVGGSPQFIYQWSNGASTQNISALPAGSYSLTVTDSLGCVLNLSALNVSQPAILASSASVSDLLCFNDNSGSMLTSTAGGTTPYNYLWNVGLTAQNLTSASAGIYTVSITDANGCLTVINDTITEPPLLQTSTLQVIPQTCTNDGSVTVSVSGGTSTYNYSWSNGSTTQNISGLQPGSYNLIITDTNGCTVSNLNNQIAQIGSQSVTINSIANISCNGNSDGSIDLNVIGGTLPFIFNWNNGLTTEDINTLPAGDYDITVTDSLGCIVSINSISITEPAILSVNNTVNDLLCNGANSGSILSNVQGGTLPYNFIWSNGATTQNLTGISGAIYDLTITDANGCVVSQNAINVFEPTAVSINNLTIIDASCGVNDGTINITASGGTGSLFYLWSNGETLEDISNLPQGNYIVTVTDINNCSTSSSLLQLNGTPALAFSLTSTNELCAEPGTGTITLNNVSGTLPYNFLWSNGETTENLLNVNSGIYEVTVTDSDNCTFVTNTTITTPFVPLLNPGVWPTLAVDTSLGYGDVTSILGGVDQTAQGVTYNWTYSGIGTINFSDLNTIDTDIDSRNEGLYTLFLTATSLDGCLTVDSIQVYVEGFNPQIPTAFSPNGDGNNDIFRVVDIELESIIEFKIYNRWGQIIYDNPKIAEWDGTYNGIMQNRDAYIYIISWNRPDDGKVEKRRGSITLLR